MRNLRVLIVDDSALNRQNIGDILTSIPGVEVVGKASDGDEALRFAVSQQPDLITLDLEMPRMDGFTFLRLLMSSHPTPVVIISGHAAKENVFRALELGAIDFISKPHESSLANAEPIEKQLKRMVKTVRQLSPSSFALSKRRAVRTSVPSSNSFRPTMSEKEQLVMSKVPPEKLVVIASSTGGPTALLEVFARLPSVASAAVIVAQHMPERFTRTFAERLDRLSSFHVQEASDTQTVVAGSGLVCPGGRSIEVIKEAGEVIAKVVWPDPSDRYAPSADRLFSSAAKALGERVIGVVLTGMGDDGAVGVSEVKKAGGIVITEAEETAVIFGMPRAAQRSGAVDRSLPLRDLSEYIVELIS